MSRLYVPPSIKPSTSPNRNVLLNSSTNFLQNSSLAPARQSFYHPDSYRQYITRHTIAKKIRGSELFVRSIRRVIENIREINKRKLNDQQLFSTYEEAINVFQELTFMKCVILKKKLLDPNNREWTIEFAERGGLQELLTYLERMTTKTLSLVDAILVNEVLQCLRAMMNISDLFEHIASSPKYVDSIAKGMRK